MNVHAVEALEFARVRELLCQRASSASGKILADRLEPLTDLAAVRTRLETVGEIVALRLKEPQWPSLTFPSLEEALLRVSVAGAVLEPDPLLAVAEALRLAARVARFFRPPEQRESWPRLTAIADRLLVEKDFPRRIEQSFEPSGELRDAASATLRSIRTQIRRSRQSVSARLEGMSRNLRGSGEDSFVTLRAGRYVVSAATTERGRLKGIVHDRSASGKTVYLEPLEIVELNNALAELDADERIEVHRILRELTGWVREHAAPLGETQEALAQLDELNARAALAEDLEAVAPAIDERGSVLRIVKGRHPLLHLVADRAAIPLELTLEGDHKVLIISGPNMGGKTVVLKTAGLLTLMALAGLFVPAADGSVLPWVDEIFVDIGDEQSLEGDLSTYAGHLRNMQAILGESSLRSLVLIDELGAGTDPDEGAALGMALLEEVGRRGCLCVATTHLGALKAFAAENVGFQNGAMEHDPETFSPTYTLHVGLPGRSHAFELARREGWSGEILACARRFLAGDRVQTEALLAQIQAHRQEARAQLERASAEREKLEASRDEFRRLSKALQAKMDTVRIEKAIEEDRRLRDVRRMLHEVKTRAAQVEDASAPAQAASVRKWVHEREREIAALEKTRPPVPLRPGAGRGGRLTAQELVPGNTAYSHSLGVDVILGGREASGDRIWVEHKGVRVRVSVADLAPARSPAPAAGPAPIVLHSDAMDAAREAAPDVVSAEVDLRGLDREACLQKLDLYLDRATLAGLSRVRIIHGKGTGVLHREVGRFLEGHAQVVSHRGGENAEGGWGVTIAFLREGAPSSAGDEDPTGKREF